MARGLEFGLEPPDGAVVGSWARGRLSPVRGDRGVVFVEDDQRPAALGFGGAGGAQADHAGATLEVQRHRLRPRGGDADGDGNARSVGRNTRRVGRGLA